VATTVRISKPAHATLRALAKRARVPMQAVLDQAIEAYRRQLLLEELNGAYAALRQDPEAWADLERERASWAATLQDGLHADEVWSEGCPMDLSLPRDRGNG
jgi:hypothetical protein